MLTLDNSRFGVKEFIIRHECNYFVITTSNHGSVNYKNWKLKRLIDKGSYKTGIKISDEKMENISISPSAFHGEWSYSISPQ